VPLDERELFYPLTHLSILREEGRRAGLSPALVCGLIRQESLFQPGIVSRAGTVGAYAALYGLPDPPGPWRLTTGASGASGIRPVAAAPDDSSRPSGGR
jgi:hypothetical protein